MLVNFRGFLKADCRVGVLFALIADKKLTHRQKYHEEVQALEASHQTIQNCEFVLA